MQINGKEIRFSISNKNHAANFEKAIRAMEKDEERIRKMSQGKLGDVLDALIRMFRKLFLTATGEDVLKDCEDAQEAKEAYDEFLSAVREQKEHFLSPYSLERIK